MLQLDIIVSILQICDNLSYNCLMFMSLFLFHKWLYSVQENCDMLYSFGKWHLGSSHGNSKEARQIGNTILGNWILAYFSKKIDNFCSTFL